MTYVNKKSPQSSFRKDAHENFMGGLCYDMKDPFLRLRIVASSCFFGEPMYYHKDPDDARGMRESGSRLECLSIDQVKHLSENLNEIAPREWRTLTPASLVEKVIDEALESDPERTLREAARLRNEDHMRTTPQVILVRAANHPKVRGTGLVRKYAPEIVKRGDEPAVGLAYQLGFYGAKAPIPNSLKKAWREALSGFTEYQLAKYRMENRAVKTVDVVNLVCPKSVAVDKLSKGLLKTTGETWEAIISQKGGTKEAWEEVIDTIFIEVEE